MSPTPRTATEPRPSRVVARFVHGTRWSDIPERVRHEAKRSLLNAIATALGGCRETAIDKAMSVLGGFAGTAACGLMGRPERTDMLLAAQVNAMSSNIFDFDDTHPATIIHPTGPVMPALFALAETTPVTGEALLRAFILGAEIECRLGNAVSPWHYARGWHITSTCGVFGSALGSGALLGLDEDQLVWALGNASAQASGLVETLGTMSKSISVGNAARNGLVSALLAKAGYSGPEAPLEGARGFLPVYADAPRTTDLTGGLGETWEIAKNTYKPYPVGVVLNPVIEAFLGFYARKAVAVEDIAEVELTGNPFLQQRANRPDVMTGRESQVSAQHAIAIVLTRGRAGIAEFSDAAVAETARRGIRPTVRFIDDAGMDIESVKIAVRTRSGSTITQTIKDTRGGSKNAMSDADLEDKLQLLAEFGRFKGDAKALAAAVWSLDRAPDAAAVMRLCCG